jgi:hypothetical protein
MPSATKNLSFILVLILFVLIILALMFKKKRPALIVDRLRQTVRAHEIGVYSGLYSHKN